MDQYGQIADLKARAGEVTGLMKLLEPVASRLLARQFARYHREMVEFFDIGNHLELAGRILARPQFDPDERLPVFNVETNKAVYLAANGGIHRADVLAAKSRVKV